MKLSRWFNERFSSLSMQFFLNYMMLFGLLSLIGLTAFGGSFVYVYNRLDLASLSFNVSSIYTDYEAQGLEEAYIRAGLPAGSYIELIDSNLKVLDQYNSIHPLGYQYRQDLFNRILINYFPEYTFYYPDGSDTILLVVTPEFKKSMDFLQMLLLTGAIVLLSLIVVVLVYSKMTSVLFLKPVIHIMEGVQRISNGDYSTHITFKSHNELEHLKNAINLMSEKIQEEIDRRERSENNQRRLILDISHDLKTPLTNIAGYSENLLNSLENSSTEDIKKHLQIILNNSTRANTLLQDLFDLARLKSSMTQPVLERTDICEFVRQVASSYIHELEANEMIYDIQIPETEWSVNIAPKLMARALGNLLINGIKYSGPHTTLKLWLEKKDSESNILIFIEDTGPGIGSDSNENVFLPFYRTDASRSNKSGGTGLGLSISKAIVEHNHGTLSLDTSYTNGCRFIIELPNAQEGTP